MSKDIAVGHITRLSTNDAGVYFTPSAFAISLRDLVSEIGRQSGATTNELGF